MIGGTGDGVGPDRRLYGACRLLRADGTEWRVVGLHHGENGLEVDAVRFAAPPSGVGRPDGAAPRLRRLEGELLSRGDLLQWIGEEGDVVSSLPVPVKRARA